MKGCKFYFRQENVASSGKKEGFVCTWVVDKTGTNLDNTFRLWDAISVVRCRSENNFKKSTPRDSSQWQMNPLLSRALGNAI